MCVLVYNFIYYLMLILHENYQKFVMKIVKLIVYPDAPL